jgi:hypothetical protein
MAGGVEGVSEGIFDSAGKAGRVSFDFCGVSLTMGTTALIGGAWLVTVGAESRGIGKEVEGIDGTEQPQSGTETGAAVVESQPQAEGAGVQQDVSATGASQPHPIGAGMLGQQTTGSQQDESCHVQTARFKCRPAKAGLNDKTTDRQQMSEKRSQQ